MDELNLISNEVEIKYLSLDDLTYEWKGEDLIELFVDDFYTGDCSVYIDDELCEPRYYIELNYEVIYLSYITKRLNS